jgi:hypothetical protein
MAIRSKAAGMLRKKAPYWLKQNMQKASEWTALAKKGHDISHLMNPGAGYAGKIMIDKKVYTYDEARKKFGMGPD